MAYDPEKTNANKSGNLPPKTPVSDKTARGIGKIALGKKK